MERTSPFGRPALVRTGDLTKLLHAIAAPFAA
jgi:hypothetical protein